MARATTLPSTPMLISTSQSTPSNTPTTNALASLRSALDILHLSFHRNKNQHRLARWWGELSQLRRQVGRLITEMEALERAERFDVPASGLKKKKAKKGGNDAGDGDGGAESKYVRAAKEKVRDRVDFMEMCLVPGAYAAFTNLIADNQYAPLGLVLMATLARVKRIIRPFGKALESSDPTSSRSPSPVAGVLSKHENKRDVDLGEVVSRSEMLEMGEVVAQGAAVGGGVGVKDVEMGLDDEAGDEEGEQEDEDSVTMKQVKPKKRKEAVQKKEVSEDEEAPKKKKKTRPPIEKEKAKKKKSTSKKKGGDAFDDLFSSLI